ncbi:MAG: recombinase family protein [Romboutsia sp.]|nr:recombinase family protein [Romboutsia sp.]
MVYGYARCSTNEDRQDIDRQIRELKELGATYKTIYLEYSSGTKKDRVEFSKLLDLVKPGDTIITTEVSRLSRSTQHLCEVINIVKDKKIKLVIGSTMTIDCTKGELDPMTNAFLQMSGVFAELERNIISQRVKSGLENAKAKGRIGGRPKVNADKLPKGFYKYYEQWKNKDITKVEFSRLLNVSRPTLDGYIKAYENKNNPDLIKYKIIKVLSIKKDIELGNDIFNEYCIKVENLNNGFIENQYKLIHIDDDKGQIKKGHIFSGDMYKK